MPIPGPPPPTYAAPIAPTGSPFWLSLNGVWVHIEGLTPTGPVTTERPSSSITSTDGNRYEQRGRLARRAWSWTMPFAAAAHLAAVRAAVDSDNDVWLMSDAVAVGNMLASRDCWGPEVETVDCGGVPLPSFSGGETVTGRVRGGVPTTISCWVETTALALVVTYPGGVVNVEPVAAGQVSATFTPAADGVVSIMVDNFGISGLMLTEGTPEPTWVPGESMPCKVVIDDPDDVLTMQHLGTWRHDYAITLREVG